MMTIRISTIAALAIALFVGVGVARADEHEADVKSAQAASEAWLKLIDDGNYQQSWSDASGVFQSAISEKGWADNVDNVRRPLGKLESRKLISARFLTSLPGMPDGKYVVIQYATTYANKKFAVEQVTPILESDGKWHVSG